MFNPWFFLTLLTDQLPIFYLHFFLFKDKLRTSVRNSILIYTGIGLLMDLGIMYLSTMDFYTDALGVILRVSLCAIGVIEAVLLYEKLRADQVLYLTLMSVPYIILILAFSAVVVSIFPENNLPEFMLITIARMVITAFVAYPVYQLWKRLLVPAVDYDDRKIWGIAALCQLLLDGAMALSLDSTYYTNGINFIKFDIFIFISVSSIFLSMAIFYVIERAKILVIEEEKQEKSKMLLELSAKQYEGMLENIEETRRFSHDLRHHLMLLGELAREKKTDEIVDYIENYTNSIPENTNKRFSKVPAVNALLNYYYGKAIEHGIECNFSIEAFVETVISDIDFSVMVGNAIENAIEACDRLEKTKPFLNFKTKEKAGNIYLIVDNTFEGHTKYTNDGDLILSSKRAYVEAGYGISSIRAIAQKYGGDIRTDIKDNKFCLSIVIPMNCP